MDEHIRTIVNSDKEFTSNSEEFYRNYWTESAAVKKETIEKNRSILNRFFPQGLSDKKLLEIGVGGEGGTLFQLMDKNEVHGLDVSDSAINNCRRFGISVTKANLDNDAVPFPDNCFDVVFAFEVFEHFANPQHVLEEIKRVLKPGGIFLCSIPATCTYHWPRLFYAGLFERENFEDFIMANEFKVICSNDWMIQNRYGRYKISPEISSWSWYYYSEKLGSVDNQGYLEVGRHFWEKRDEFGIRIRPIEAIELFRKSLKCVPDFTDAKLLMAHSLLYRAINGDRDEFLKHVDEIITYLMGQAGDDKIKYLARLLLINIEAGRFGIQLLNPDDYIKLKTQLGQANGTTMFIDEISREEEISERLASRRQ